MKTQIRRGVFETNSSSTHSLQIVNGDVNNAYDYIINRISKKYAETLQSEHYFNYKSYLLGSNNDTLSLEGLDFENGDEQKCVYVVCNNWMAKIQYIAMLLADLSSYATEIEEYNDMIDAECPVSDYDGNWYKRYQSSKYRSLVEKMPKFSDTEIYKAFVEIVTKYIKEKQGIEITEVHYDMDYSVYNTEAGNGEQYISKDVMKDSAKLKQVIWDLLNSDVSMIYIDEAYHPYEGPAIQVL